MGIGYSRPSRSLTDPPLTHSVPPLGISNKVNEPTSQDLTMSEQSKAPVAETPLSAVANNQRERRARGSDIETVPLLEDQPRESNLGMKRSEPVAPGNFVSSATKRRHSSLIDEAVAGASKSNHQVESGQPFTKKSKKAPATSSYVTEPVVLARPRKSARLEDANRNQAMKALSTLKASAESPTLINAKATAEREDGELTDEDSKPVPKSPLPPKSIQPVAASQKPIPTKPAADSRRSRYLDRDALPSRPTAAGKAAFLSQKVKKVDALMAPVPVLLGNKAQPQDTSSGLPYEDIYVDPIPSTAVEFGKQNSKHSLRELPISDSSHAPPWTPDAITQRMAYKGVPDQAAALSSGSHAYAIAPQFYQQYSRFQPFDSERAATPHIGSPESQDSGIHHDQYSGRRLDSDEDVEDRAAEQAVAENDRLGLEQARKWAQEQSARHEHRLDEAGLRELVRLLLQLKSWGVPTTDFVRRGVPLSLLRAIHAVISTNRSADPISPPPPPPTSLPPPPPPPIRTRDRPRRDSIASSVEMDIATPTPSPEIRPQSHRIIKADEPQSGPTMATAQPSVQAVQALLHDNTLLQPNDQPESLQSTLKASSENMLSVQDQEAEARHASEVSAIRVKLLAAKLRKQKEIKARLRKLQEDAVASSIMPPVLRRAKSPEVNSPEVEETLIQLLQMSSPAQSAQTEPDVQANSAPASLSPNLVAKRLRNGSNRAKLSDLVDQPAVVADSSSYFPTKVRSTHVRRTTLAPPHPKHFVINLDTDSESENEQDIPSARAPIASRETETRDAEALKREIEKKLAARAALEARIAAMEARKQAKRQRAIAGQQSNETVPQPGSRAPMEQANVSEFMRKDVDKAVDMPKISAHGLAMEIDSEPVILTDRSLPAVIEDDRDVLLKQLQQVHTQNEEYLRMPVDIGPGSKDVQMIQADVEQTETEMLREALVLSSYENHAIRDPGPIASDRDEVDEEDITEPQLAISHPRARELVGSRSPTAYRDAFQSFHSLKQESARRFETYEPLTNKIPLTAAQPVKIRTRSNVSVGTGFLYRDPAGNLDTSILDAIMWSRINETRRDFVLCLYEEGGGICADATCSNLHMSRDVIPTLQDLLKLVNIILPPSSSAHPTLQQAILAIPEIPTSITDYINGITKMGLSGEDGRVKRTETSAQPGEAGVYWPDRLHDAIQARTRAVDDFLKLLQKAI